MSKPNISKEDQKKIALQRITTLFAEAEKTFSEDKKRANHYVALARKIAMRVKLHLPLELKRKYCKYCYALLMPGVNSRVRKREGKVVISCFECKRFTRIVVKKKKVTFEDRKS
ncbi:ribonuclease P [Candidatus Woesearchaeota archaeon]|nr:ribonuclease P [Candidatus Woesearchaeota archaeon]